MEGVRMKEGKVDMEYYRAMEQENRELIEEIAKKEAELELVKSTNQKLKGEIEGIEEEITVLIKERSTIKVFEATDSTELNQQVTTGLDSLIGLAAGVSTIKSQKEIHGHIQGTIFIPSRHGRKTPSGQICCKGCSKKFLDYGGVAERDYYIHCINECSQYQELNLIRKCGACSKIFTNSNALGSHNCETPVSKPERPMWMSQAIYEKSFFVDDSNCSDRECPGCRKIFKAAAKKCANGKQRHRTFLSFEYLVHLIDECGKYKNLNLIKTCKECGCKFVSEGSLKGHSRFCAKK